MNRFALGLLAALTFYGVGLWIVSLIRPEAPKDGPDLVQSALFIIAGMIGGGICWGGKRKKEYVKIRRIKRPDHPTTPPVEGDIK